MKNIILLIALASASIGNTLMADGWGQKQTQRTVGGGLSGATIGGIIGHQHGKQKEGIIIGSVLGMIIGNKSGKGADHRAEQQRWEQQKREMAHREELRRREQERQRQYRYQQMRNANRTTSNYGGTASTDELTQARHRAEQREAELHRELEIRRIQEERRRALLEFQERERRAQEQLERVRNGQAPSQNISYSPVHY